MADSFDPSASGPLGTQRRYKLSATIKIVEQSYKDWDLVNRSHKAVILLPLESTQRTLFYDAWLPSFDEDEASEIEGARYYEEIVFRIDSPIGLYARGAVILKSKHHSTPHIYLMTAGSDKENRSDVTELLIKLGEGKKIHFTVLREDEEKLADNPRCVN